MCGVTVYDTVEHVNVVVSFTLWRTLPYETDCYEIRAGSMNSIQYSERDMNYTLEESRFDSRHREKDFLSSPKRSDRIWGPLGLIQWAPRQQSQEVGLTECNSGTTQKLPSGFD